MDPIHSKSIPREEGSGDTQVSVSQNDGELRMVIEMVTRSAVYRGLLQAAILNAEKTLQGQSGLLGIRYT